jgi:RimJ/RimL family protein N-acetyltransferase
MNNNFWQGEKIRLRGIEPSDAETFFKWNMDSERARAIDIAPEHRRKGYASEVILLVLKYYFEELRYQKVTVSIHSYNEASLKLHKHLGFIEEGRLRRMVYTRGQYFDTIWVGMRVEEFRERYF